MTRKASRALRAAKADYLRHDIDGRAMLDLAVVWLGKLPGFERTTPELREAVVIDVLGRELCQFEAYEDAFGLPSIRLADSSGRMLPLSTLYAAKLRVKLKGAFSYG